MPELPEVEAVRTGLEMLVIGKKVKEVDVFWPKIIEAPEYEQFETNLIGQTLEKMSRRGKFLIFEWTNFDMISHLRMEGKYEVHQQEDPIEKHTHVVFTFTDQTQLRYLDVRKFGRMTLLKKGQAKMYKGLMKLGPEPIQPDFSLEVFKQQLKRHQKAIKPLLLDQTLVTGLGNIYVDEVLFEAKIDPEQPASSLTKTEVEGLYHAIIAVLARAVKAGGTTVRTYKNALGEAGKFQVQLKVYGKTGSECVRCGTLIKKIKVAQRGTYFCPTCQVRHD